MGNKMMSTRAFVDEQYTRPQAFFDPTVLDYRKLRRLILNGQLAPCFPGGEECMSDLDECPICFLNYPSLNRSRCCSKAICTECYLQIKSAHFDRSAECPFCKTSSYTVEFRGAKTAKEKGIEQAEEQKVIEAKIRIRQKELHDEAERVRILKEGTQAEPFEHEGSNTLMESGISAQAAHMQGSLSGSNRTEGYLDMEDLILMEALSLSIQEQGPVHQEFDDPPRHIPARLAGRARRLRRVLATRAERQATSAEIRGGVQVVNSSQNSLESNKNLTANSPEGRDLAIRSCRAEDPLYRGFDANGGLQKDVLTGKRRRSSQNAIHGTNELNGWSDNSKESSWWQWDGRDLEQSSSEAAEAGTSFSSNIIALAPEPWEAPDGFLSSQSQVSVGGETSLSSALAALSFEDQIMLATALSAADAQEAQEGRY